MVKGVQRGETWREQLIYLLRRICSLSLCGTLAASKLRAR
jgi:hypothetical protein